jgi:hypothetical protein
MSGLRLGHLCCLLLSLGRPRLELVRKRGRERLGRPFAKMRRELDPRRRNSG